MFSFGPAADRNGTVGPRAGTSETWDL